jgi:septin family protein
VITTAEFAAETSANTFRMADLVESIFAMMRKFLEEKRRQPSTRCFHSRVHRMIYFFIRKASN